MYGDDDNDKNNNNDITPEEWSVTPAKVRDKNVCSAEGLRLTISGSSSQWWWLGVLSLALTLALIMLQFMKVVVSEKFAAESLNIGQSFLMMKCKPKWFSLLENFIQ